MEERMEGKHKIAIVGPESSGKSSLTEELAAHFRDEYVEEKARPYLLERNGEYGKADLLEIAQLQLIAEKEAYKKSERFLFCDTNLLVIKIWSLWKYETLDEEIEKLWKPADYAFHLLCYPDLEYEDDPLRENPAEKERLALFDIYQKELDQNNLDYTIIKGKGEVRLKKAIESLRSRFSL